MSNIFDSLTTIENFNAELFANNPNDPILPDCRYLELLVREIILLMHGNNYFSPSEKYNILIAMDEKRERFTELLEEIKTFTIKIMQTEFDPYNCKDILLHNKKTTKIACITRNLTHTFTIFKEQKPTILFNIDYFEKYKDNIVFLMSQSIIPSLCSSKGECFGFTYSYALHRYLKIELQDFNQTIARYQKEQDNFINSANNSNALLLLGCSNFISTLSLNRQANQITEIVQKSPNDMFLIDLTREGLLHVVFLQYDVEKESLHFFDSNKGAFEFADQDNFVRFYEHAYAPFGEITACSIAKLIPDENIHELRVDYLKSYFLKVSNFMNKISEPTIINTYEKVTNLLSPSCFFTSEINQREQKMNVEEEKKETTIEHTHRV